MARFLRSASSLRRCLFLDTQESRRGLLETPVLSHHFSTKAKKKSKSDGASSGDENPSAKDIALKQAMEQIQSTFGKGSIMWLGRGDHYRQVPVISTGSFALDIALGVGGFPKGRVVEIYGPEASGKTTLSLHVIAEAQKQGDYCAFIDAEHALDPNLAETLGVNTKNLLISQPDCGEQALSLVDTLIRSGAVDVIVVDSVAALVPKGELDGEMGDAHMAMQARLMSQALRKISHSLSLSKTILIFTNQLRAKLGGFSYGPTETTCGGNALKFYASIRLNVRRIGSVKKGEQVIGNSVLVKIVKNKHAPPFREASFELIFGEGISREGELIDFGIKHKLIQKTGGHLKMGDGPSKHGKEQFKKWLSENEAIKNELEQKLRDILIKETPADSDADEETSVGSDEETLALSEV